MRVVHVQDAPARPAFATHGEAMSGDMLYGRVNRIIVGIPEGIAECLNLVHFHFVTEVGSVLEISLA